MWIFVSMELAMEFLLIFGEMDSVEVPKIPQNLQPTKKSSLRYHIKENF